MAQITGNQRVVFLHRDGLYAGIPQIAGIWDSQEIPSTVGPFTSTLPDKRRNIFGRLVKATPRLIVFTETVSK